ncbi:MAG: cation transporter [Chloroflexi bacterium]|nr:MAG: cation transporter [Chloroflexota bacterium]
MTKHTLRLAFFLTVFILLAGYIGGFVANSLALLSDASHSLTDLFALGLAWFAAVQAERPSDHRKTFGYHRVGILVALLNAVSLILIAGSILWEAVQRFQHPEPVQPLVIFVSAAIAIAINLFIAFGLRKEGGDNLNARAVSLHVLGDVAASVGVIVGGIVILLTGWEIVDPLLSVGIAILVAVGSWHILTETVDILLEAVPKNISIAHLVQDMKKVPGVQDVHDLHIWSIASGIHALSCHVLIDDLPPSDSSTILQSLTTVLRKKYHIEHATIQFECDFLQATHCGQTELYCQLNINNAQTHHHAH